MKIVHKRFKRASVAVSIALVSFCAGISQIFKGQWMWLDKHGNLTVCHSQPPTNESNRRVWQPSEGLQRRQTGSNTDYYNEREQVVMTVPFYYARNFHDGLAAVYSPKENRWSYIDKSGQVAISLPANCSAAEDFSEGLAAIALGGVDLDHSSYTQTMSVHASNVRPGALWAFIDRQGRIVIPPKFTVGTQEVRSKYYSHTYLTTEPATHPRFSEGLAAVAVGGELGLSFGFIDRTGAWIVKPKFNHTTDFCDGKSLVYLSFLEIVFNTLSKCDRSPQFF